MQQFPDYDSFQTKCGCGSEQRDERKSEVQAAELIGSQIPRDPHADEQPHSHAHKAIDEKPAHVPQNLAEAGPDFF
jgi:hypothetical protein